MIKGVSMPFGLFSKAKKESQDVFFSPWIVPYTGPANQSHLATRNTVGIKGINLIELASLDMPVPPGFIVNTSLCNHYIKHGEFPEDFEDDLKSAIHFLEKEYGRSFEDPYNPLLLSVRNSPTENLPLDKSTVMNIGLNDTSVAGLSALYQDKKFAWDCYRRLMTEYAISIQNVPAESLEDVLKQYCVDHNLKTPRFLDDEDWQAVIRKYKGVIEKTATEPFPQNTYKQLFNSIEAFIKNWQSYEHQIRNPFDDIHNKNQQGFALIVQAMVYGNLNDDSGTGIAFTRDPSNGENSLKGYFVRNGQGEDYLNPFRTPRPLTIDDKNRQNMDDECFEDIAPKMLKQLEQICKRLERHYRDMLSIKFCVEGDQLFVIESKHGKRTSVAAIKIALDMVNSHMIGRSDAITRINPLSLEQLLKPRLPEQTAELLCTGVSASSGVVSGRIVFQTEIAEELAREGVNVIYCAEKTTKNELRALHSAAGILTTSGGHNSHAAITSRSMGRPSVVGAKNFDFDGRNRCLKIKDQVIKAGDIITINGHTGEVFKGAVDPIDKQITKHVSTLIEWADEYRRMKIYTNVESMEDIADTINIGAEGIGLLKTEMVFANLDPINKVKLWSMTLSSNRDERLKYLGKLTTAFEKSFERVLKEIPDQPLTIRLPDKPMHDFLPNLDDTKAIKAIAKETKRSEDDIAEHIKLLKAKNTLVGLRGCRIGINFPQLYAVVIKSMFKSLRKIDQSRTVNEPIQIIIPFVASRHEVRFIREIIDTNAAQAVSEPGARQIPYKVGAMIEIPRAAMRGSEIVEYADFISFGTNDMTELAFGISGDDTQTLMPDYLRRHVFNYDPFSTLDTIGLGEMITLCMRSARTQKPGIKIGLCGDHGGDPRTIDFCEYNGMDFISCAPQHVPIARLAAAQASLKYDGSSETH